MSYKISKQHQINRPAISVKSKYDNNYSFANEQEEPPAEYNFTDSPEFEEDQDISEDDQEFEEDDSPSPEFYMKRIRRLSFLANMFCHIALWIFFKFNIFPLYASDAYRFFPFH